MAPLMVRHPPVVVVSPPQPIHLALRARVWSAAALTFLPASHASSALIFRQQVCLYLCLCAAVFAAAFPVIAAHLASVSPVLSPPPPASRYCHLVPSGHGGLCASSALGLAKPLLQPSRSISSAHFLLLKAVVLAVADGRRPGRRAAAFPAWLMGIPSDCRTPVRHASITSNGQ